MSSNHRQNLLHEPLAIVGMACRLPGADNLDEYWRLLVEGRNAITELPPERLDRDLYYDPNKGVRGKTYSTLGGIITDRPLDLEICPLQPEELSHWDPCHLVMCEVAAAACRHAGYDVRNIPHRNTGVYIGHSGGSNYGSDLVYATLAAETAEYLKESPGFASLPAKEQAAIQASLVQTMRAGLPHRDRSGGPEVDANAAASIISRTLGLTGPHLVTDAACASSVVALSMAALAVQFDQVDMAIVGGASYNKTDSLVLFSQAQSCSATGTRPFDENADGLISSEGYVALVIKKLSRAVADGDTIQAVLPRMGLSADGRGKSLWAPRKEGQMRAMQRAYSGGSTEDALSPGDIQYLEAHATSTQIGDATEMEALGEFFGPHFHGRSVPVGSVKSNIGHTLETAGLASLLKTVLAIQHGQIPPTINVDQPNCKIPWKELPFQLPSQATQWPAVQGKPRRAGVNAFGIGGLNVHVVVEEFQPRLQPLSGSPKSTTTVRQPEPIAIVGRGLILPGAQSIDSFAKLLDSGMSQITEAPSARWRDRRCVAGSDLGTNAPWKTTSLRGGFINDYEFDWRKYRIPPKQIANANPLQFMLLDAARQALAEAGYHTREFDREQSAVVVGTIFGGEFGHELVVGLRLPLLKKQLRELLASRGYTGDQSARMLAEFEEQLIKAKPALIDETGSFTSSTLASRISKELNLAGGAMAVDAGECSSDAALSVAVNLLRSGACSHILCAGAQRSMDLANYEALTLQGRLAGSTKDPGEGYVPGEGVAMLLLKRLSDAQRDGDQVLGTIEAIGAGASSAKIGEAIQSSATRLTSRLGASSTLSSITSGLGVAELDQTERQALQTAGIAPEKLAENRLVSQIGNTMGAQTLATIVAGTILGEQETQAISNHAASGLAYTVAYTKGVPQEKQKQVVAETQPTSIPTLHRFSGNDVRELLENLNTNKQGLAQEPTQFRLVAVVSSPEEFSSQQSLAARMLAGCSDDCIAANTRRALAAKGVYVAKTKASRPKVAFVFPGQGSQYAGMLADLAEHSPSAKSVLAEANQHLLELGGQTFEQLAGKQASQLGQDIWATQASMLTADLLALAWLKDLGVEPDVVCGHSFGEFAAMTAAGCATPDQALHITHVRTEALNRSIRERGALLSLQADVTRVETLIALNQANVSITHRNAPEQTVVGGSLDEVRRFEQLATREEINCRLLQVPCAFHTPLMAASQPMLAAGLEKVRLQPARVPYLSSVSNHYLADPVGVRENLVNQLVSPVVYCDMIGRLVAEGCDLFVEVGPQTVLTRLNEQILASHTSAASNEIACLAVDHQRRSREEQAAHIRAQCEVLGIPLGTTVGRRSKVEPARLNSHQESMTTHQILHFDATQTRKARLRSHASSQVSPPPTRETAVSIERFDATSNRRERTRANAKGHAMTATVATELKLASDAPAFPSASPPPAGLDQFLIDFVVEQTGYPAEIIELDWDMEADLGIDSIKKAQLFGELREMFDLEQAIDPELAAQFSLDQFRTLRDVLELLEQSGGKTEWLTDTGTTTQDLSYSPAIPEPQPSLAQQPKVSPVAESFAQQSFPQQSFPQEPFPQEIVEPNTLAELGGLETFLVDFVVEQTGYPPEIVELDADLEADLGIDSIKKAQLFGELREHFTIEVESTDRFSLSDFRTLRDVLNLLRQVTAGQVETVSIKPTVSDSEPPKLLTSPPAAPTPRTKTSDFNHVYRDSVQRGTAHAQSIRAHLLDAADRFAVSTEQASLQNEATLRRQFSNRQWQELSGLAEGAGVDVRSIAAYNLLRDDAPANGDLPMLVTTEDVNADEAPELYQSVSTPNPQVQESGKQVTKRRILRMQPEPLLPGVPTVPELHGAAAILGVGPLAQAFRGRIEELGQRAMILPETASPTEAVAELDRLWQNGPVTHLFIVTPCEPSAETTFDAKRWSNRRPRGLQTPFSVCQRWIKRIVDEGLSEQASLVGVTSLGGDFGFCEPVFSAEGGGIAGLLKGMMIENWVNGIRTLPIKLIDAAPHNSPREVVDAAMAELAAGTFDTEVTCSGGERRVVRAEDQPLNEPATKPIQRGGNWVFTGGGRGITAHVAHELASRFGLKAHLIGTAPVPQVPDAWRNLDEAGLKRVKLEVMTEARTAGDNPVQAWKNVEKSLEIDETLQRLASAGVQAHYYSCDVADRAALGRTLDEIRATSGPIQGIIHGAGVGKDARFENKDPVKVEQCLRAKIDGALALMQLTQDDPLEYFAGFGSISGRFGANGHADYSLGNDMLAKLIGWYRRQRPGVAAVAFHWHAWGDVGMATRPEVKLALEMVDMQFMPAAEGVAHLIRELEAGAPEGEVLITDDRYRRLFFPSAMPEQSADSVAPCPLLDRGETTSVNGKQDSTFRLNPTTDPFLREHRLDDRPLLPIVVGMEMLAEAGSRALECREGLTLTNLKAENGLRFHTDKPHPVTVVAERVVDAADCRLIADVVSRNGQLVEARRPYLSGQVQAGITPAKPAWLTPPPSSLWEPVRYPARGSKFYLGEPLRGLRSIQIAENQAWGQIASQSVVHLAGPRHSVTGWIVPSAAIDACLYATGLLAWFTIEEGTALPESIARLSLGREPYAGERCLVQSRFKRREDRYGWFDFALTGANGDLLVEVEDYRIVWLPKS